MRRAGGLLVAVGVLAGGLSVARSAQGAENPAAGAITRHALQARVDTTGAMLAVTDTITIAHDPNTPASRAFPFLLARSLTIRKAVGIGGTGRPFPVSVTSENRLNPRDYWANPPYDELDGYQRARTVRVSAAKLGESWPESIRVVLTYSGVVYDSLRAPKAAYSRGFEETSGLIDPRGAFLNGGTFWVPTRPDERFTFRCAIETPPGWRGVSQGALVASRGSRASVAGAARASRAHGGHSSGDRSSSAAAKTHTDVWDSPQPMEEIFLIAGPYTLRQAQKAGVAVMTFTYANTDSSICQRYIDGTERYLKMYGGKIGPYPFAKFALVENFWQTGFGMPSFTLLGNQVIRLPFILDTSYGHEILHNWWGNGVNVDYARGNWCEGLTVYGADYLYKEMAGSAEARDYRRTALQGYTDYVSANKDLPLRLFREREDFATQALGYGKSMMVFHQVRRLLGDDAWWGALQEFYKAHLFRTASWDDLFEVFSKRAGRDLSGWKAQWIDRAGAPTLALKDRRIEGSKVEVTIAQTQSDLYDLRVPVRIGWNAPTPAETTQVVSLSQAEATCAFQVSRPPDWVAVDPDFDVLRRIDPAEIPAALSRTLGADTAIVVIASGLPPEAAEAYAKMAADWGKGTKLGILRETEIQGPLPALPTWYFGLGPAARRAVAGMNDPSTVPAGGLGDVAGQGSGRPDVPNAGWKIAGSGIPPGRAIVVTGGTPPRSWTVLDVPDAASIASIGRKIPHYGKYSWLVFDGDTNVGKGSWDVLSSPLRASFR